MIKPVKLSQDKTSLKLISLLFSSRSCTYDIPQLRQGKYSHNIMDSDFRYIIVSQPPLPEEKRAKFAGFCKTNLENAI
jgi:hypothetical protein